MRDPEHQENQRGGRRNRRRGTLGLLVLLWALGVTGTAFAADEIHWTITGQTSVTFDWRGTSAENTIRYGTAPGSYTATATGVRPSPTPNSSAGPFWEARLTGLQENTLYFYQIGTGPEHTFRTPPPRGTSGFWFAEEADIGSAVSSAAVVPTQAQIAADHPDLPGDDRPRFVLVAGDISYADREGVAAVDQHFNDVMAWSQDAAYMVIWGNHDYGDPVDGADDYKGRFDFPNSQISPGAPADGGPGEDWYWFDYGNVRFIAYPEPYTSETWPAWEAQVDPIMAAAQADPAITFIIVFGHNPAYSTGSHPSVGSGTAGRLAAITDRLRSKYSKYVLHINAHSHTYERICPIKLVSGAPVCTTPEEGLVHVTGAGGGQDVGSVAALQPWSVFRAKHLEHLRIHVTATRIEGFAVCGPDLSDDDDSCTQGQIIDTWSILARGSPDNIPPAAPQNLRVEP